MCGIVGYSIKADNALSLVLSSLQNLEYRGYDSAGVSYTTQGKIYTTKTVGRVSNLHELCPKNAKTNIAIAHTRWATHGSATTINAHPHHTNNISLVHNGIIENYIEIKQSLELKGCKFVSTTDTEVLSQFIAYHIAKQSPVEIIGTILNTFKGKYAIVFLVEGRDEMYIARSKGSPIVIGKLENGYAVASDFTALSMHTSCFIIMEDFEYAILSSEGVKFYNKSSQEIHKESVTREVENIALTKDGFATFMMKEIHEQPVVIANLIHNYTSVSKASGSQANGSNVKFENFPGMAGFKKIVAIACGTSFYASLLGKLVLEKYGDIPVSVQISSEFHVSKQLWEGDTLYIFASQSGETADTLSAMEYAAANKMPSSKMLSILNYAHSSMAQKSDYVIQCFAGPEVGVASTKNFIAQVVIFYLLALQSGTLAGLTLSNEILPELQKLPTAMQKMLEDLNLHNTIKIVASTVISAKKVVYTGRTLLYPIACEGALKLSELSYLIVQPIPSGEFKHGPIAIVDDTSVVISLLHSQNLYQKTLSSNEEIKARNGVVIDISDNKDARIPVEIAKDFVHTYPLLMTLVVQLLSYYTAEKLGNDIDKPRNLAKSVTVE